MEYEGINIFVLQFGHVWQYLFSWKNELYMQHVVVKAPAMNRIRFRLGLWNDKLPYTKDEQDRLEDMMLSGAMLSIDTLMGKKTDNPVIVPQPSKIPLGA